ncbi:hypothetical protein L2E82_45522 [Cichorium intybus]|uniref:Uncharacterized protein n=1 Tax=Cichorium intybus TaxID=13427 RepID=A0ACB8ZT43_CICIN|nr:hypothetical protein L2E82_45522 [Cichorium intybus]
MTIRTSETPWTLTRTPRHPPHLVVLATMQWMFHRAVTKLKLQLRLGLRGYGTPDRSVDRWWCDLTKDGVLSVAAVRNRIDGLVGSLAGMKFKWLKEVPLKVNCFIWRAIKGIIRSASALRNKGINVEELNCTYCNTEEEDANHMLIRGSLAIKVRSEIFKWCVIHDAQLHSVNELFEMAEMVQSNAKVCTRLRIICSGMIWWLWRCRNDRVFNRYLITHHSIIENVKPMVYLWVKCRGGNAPLAWDSWCYNLISCM